MSLDSAPHPLEVTRNELNYTFGCRDIEYAYPKRSGLASDRHSNPLNPNYNLGESFNPPPAPAMEPPKRDHISCADIEGTAPLPFYDKSKPARNIMDWSDVSGAAPRNPSWRNRSGQLRETSHDAMADSLFVRDINMEGTFNSRRMTNPLDPSYQYDARTLQHNDLMAPKPAAPIKQGPMLSLHTHDIEGAKPFSWNDIWAKQGDSAMRVTNYISDIDGTRPGQRAGRSNPHPELPDEQMNHLGTFRQCNPLDPGYTQLDGRQNLDVESNIGFANPQEPAFPFNTAAAQDSKPSRLPPMDGEVFPQLNPPPPEPLRVEELDDRAKARQEKKMLDFVRDKVEAKAKTMSKVFRQFDENKDGDISYAEFRLGLGHLGVDLTDGDFQMLIKKVDVDGEGTVDYNEFAEVLKAPDMQLSFMPTDTPFASGDNPRESSMKTDSAIRRKGAFEGNKRKQMGLAMLPKDDILRQIAEKVEGKSKNLRNVFRQFDEDKSGSVDLVEFRRGLAHLGFEMTDKMFDQLMNRVDRDADGDINYTEFAARLKGQDQQIGGIGGIGVSDWEAEQEAIAAHANDQAAKKGMGLGQTEEVKLINEIAEKVEAKSKFIRKVFRDFDEDFDGTVNHTEFRNGLDHLGIVLNDKRFDMLLKIVDADNSGTVDYLEFAQTLKGQDMQVGMMPKKTAAPVQAPFATKAPAAKQPPAGPPALYKPLPTPPGSASSFTSNASQKRAARDARARQAEIDEVRGL